MEKDAGKWDPQAALGSNGATARGLVREGARAVSAWQPGVQMASVQPAARKKGGLSGSSELFRAWTQGVPEAWVHGTTY